MKKLLFIPMLTASMVTAAPLALAREVVVLPGVVGATGELSGVDTQGPGALNVGNQNINTSNDAGGGITTSAANTANVVFNNSSTVTGFVGQVGSTFLNITAGAVGQTVTFNGPVFSTTFDVLGTGNVNFNGGFTSNTGGAMNFAGDGFINVASGQTVRAAITNTAGARTGTLTLNGGSILDGAVGAASGLKEIRVVGGNALITGQANAATYTLGTNTLNVAGALNTPVAGVINTTIASNLVYGKIVPVGASTIGDALQVNVNVTGPIDVGTVFNIVDATSGTDGSTVLVDTTSNSLRYTFATQPTVAGDVNITTTQVPLAVIIAPPVVVDPTAPAPVVNPIAPVLAPVVDALPVIEATVPLLTAVTLLPTPAAVADALVQLAPSATTMAAPRVAHDTTQLFHNQWASHLAQSQTCGRDSQPNDTDKARLQENASACEANDMRPHIWASAIGSTTKQGNVNGYEGFDANTRGLMAAFEAPLPNSDSLRAGAGLRFAESALTGNIYNGKTDVDSYQAVAYLGYAPGSWFVNGAVSYGLDNYSASRTVRLPGFTGQADADYSGTQATAFATAGRNFRVGDGATIITPAATLQYTHMRVDGYTETGNAATTLNVGSQKYDFVESGLGAKIARSIAVSDTQFLRPEVHANWLHSFGDVSMEKTTAFTAGGPSFTTVGREADRNSYNVGTGLTLTNVGSWSVSGAYDYNWRTDDNKSHQAMITFALPL